MDGSILPARELSNNYLADLELEVRSLDAEKQTTALCRWSIGSKEPITIHRVQWIHCSTTGSLAMVL